LSVSEICVRVESAATIWVRSCGYLAKRMNLLRLIAAASAMSIAITAAVLSAGGVGGLRNGWLDIINNFAPLIFVMGLLAVGLGNWSLAAPRERRRLAWRLLP
jgi:hypothetical protein